MSILFAIKLMECANSRTNKKAYIRVTEHLVLK